LLSLHTHPKKDYKLPLHARNIHYIQSANIVRYFFRYCVFFMTTKHSISVFCGIFVTCVLGLFWLIINIDFYNYWHTKSIEHMQSVLQSNLTVNPDILNDHFKTVIQLDPNEKLIQALAHSKLVYGAHSFQWRYYLHTLGQDTVAVTDVSSSIYRQNRLILLTTLLSLFFGVSSYICILWFVDIKFRNLSLIAKSLEKISIDKLNYNPKLWYLHPDDSISVVHKAVAYMTSALEGQLTVIKEFVAHVSHELRTPLTVLQWQTELALETKKYQETLEKNFVTIKELSWILSTMIHLTKNPDQKTFDMEEISLETLLDKLVSIYHEEYSSRNLIIEHIRTKDSSETIYGHLRSVQMILRNLLDNACKYSHQSWHICISYTKDQFSIANVGKPIPQKNHDRMREPFWQQAKHIPWSWLGLSLVKKLCDIFGYTITYSYKNNQNIFTIKR